MSTLSFNLSVKGTMTLPEGLDTDAQRKIENIVRDNLKDIILQGRREGMFTRDTDAELDDDETLINTHLSDEAKPHGDTLDLHCFGLKIRNNSITSDLHEGHLPDASEAYEAAMDAIESIVLAHHCAGIDVTEPAYLEGIETAVEALANNLD